MGSKSEIIYARISEELKNRLDNEKEKRGESEAVIVREALREYFDKRDTPQTTYRYQEPPPGPQGKLNEQHSAPQQTPHDIAAEKLGRRAVSDLPGSPAKPPAPEPSPAEPAGKRSLRKFAGIVRRGAADKSGRPEKRGK